MFRGATQHGAVVTEFESAGLYSKERVILWGGPDYIV
jgi:hypothetical protein